MRELDNRAPAVFGIIAGMGADTRHFDPVDRVALSPKNDAPVREPRVKIQTDKSAAGFLNQVTRRFGSAVSPFLRLPKSGSSTDAGPSPGQQESG